MILLDKFLIYDRIGFSESWVERYLYLPSTKTRLGKCQRIVFEITQSNQEFLNFPLTLNKQECVMIIFIIGLAIGVLLGYIGYATWLWIEGGSGRFIR